MELRHYAGILWKWAWLIVLCMLLAGGSAYLVSKRQPPTYQATATLLINQASPTTQEYTALLTSERLAKTYAQLLTKRPVMEEVARALGLNTPPEAMARQITVNIVRDTQLITLRVIDNDPARAREIANAVPVVFGKQNEDMQLSRYSSSKENLQKQLEAVNADIATTQATLDTSRAAPAPDQTQISRLQDALVQYRTTYTNLLRSYEELRIAEAKTLDTVTVVEPAVLATAPVGPRTMTNTFMAAVIGAMVAVGMALFTEYLDDTVKSPEDVERATHLSTFGAIVNFHKFSSDGAGPIAATRPKSSISEGYRVLRTNLEFSAMGTGKSGALLLVTSAQPQEGKSTTMANLGVSLAQTGKQVLLVDTDLRRPSLHKQFNLPNEAGLTSLLLEREADLERVIQHTSVQGLRVLTTGRTPANPAEILSFPETSALLERLRPLADYVLLDSPPVLSVADASILAQKADGVMLVVEMGRTRTDAFLRAVSALEKVKAHLMGVVLNKVSARPGGYYYHYYDYYYYSSRYSDDEGESRAHKKRHRASATPARGLRGAVTKLLGRGKPAHLPSAPASQASAQGVGARPGPQAEVSPERQEVTAELSSDRVQVVSPGLAALPVDVRPGQPIPRPRPKATRNSALIRLLVVLLAIAALATGALMLIRMGWIRLPAPVAGLQGYINQGRASFTVENYPEAIKQFSKALELAPDNADAKLGLEKAEQYTQVRTLYLEARTLVEQNRCDMAISKLEAVMEVDPWYKDAGVMLVRCQRYQELDGLYNQAMTNYGSAEWSKAAGALESVRNKDPAYRQTDVKTALFNCYMNDGRQRIANASSALDVVQATHSFDSASSLFPGSTVVQEEQRLAALYRDGYMAYTRSTWAEAIASLSKIYSVQPDYANGRIAQLLCDCYLKLGEAYQSSGELQLAIAQYEAVLRISQCDQAEARERQAKVALLATSASPTPRPALTPTSSRP